MVGETRNLIPAMKSILCRALGVPERNEKPKLSDSWKTRKTRDEFYNSLGDSGSKWTSTASAPINEAKLKNIVRKSIKKVLKEDDQNI